MEHMNISANLRHFPKFQNYNSVIRTELGQRSEGGDARDFPFFLITTKGRSFGLGKAGLWTRIERERERENNVR